MTKPRHLCRFPCMQPWIGPKYGRNERRLAVVGESHYLPPHVTRENYCPSTWYSTRQKDVPDLEDSHSYMNTRKCVQRRDERDIHTYVKIQDVVPFEEIAFINYLFRPAEQGKPGYSQPRSSFDILDEDRAVSSEIMEWFIQMYCPNSIVIASATVMRWSCVRHDLAAHPKIDICVTDHPRNTNPFSSDVRRFLEDKSFRGSKANLPLCLKENQIARCLSYPWRMSGGS